jgi:hypothetical protein
MCGKSDPLSVSRRRGRRESADADDDPHGRRQYMVFGSLIIFFLIVQPHGLARLSQIAKEKLRLWPFPH